MITVSPGVGDIQRYHIYILHLEKHKWIWIVKQICHPTSKTTTTSNATTTTITTSNTTTTTKTTTTSAVFHHSPQYHQCPALTGLVPSFEGSFGECSKRQGKHLPRCAWTHHFRSSNIVLFTVTKEFPSIINQKPAFETRRSEFARLHSIMDRSHLYVLSTIQLR